MAKLCAPESVHRLNQRIQFPRPPYGRSVERPHHGTWPRQAADFTSFSRLAVLGELRREGIPRSDELPRRDGAERIGGILAGFWHVHAQGCANHRARERGRGRLCVSP
jgi:hypothetical protein